MAFTPEDGTGLAGANAYISVADADAYHADRGRADWTGTDEVKQVAIVKATDFVDRNYTFVGQVKTSTQALQWPRTGVCDSLGESVGLSSVPTRVAHAVAEYARLALGMELVEQPTASNDGAVKQQSKKLGGLSKSVTYAGSANNRIRSYPTADRLLDGLIQSNTQLLRA